jgi:pteridine reductase
MPEPIDPPVALVTGAARRIGARIAEYLHQKNFRVIIHYHHSADAAEALCLTLNERRPDSAWATNADLNNISALSTLAKSAIKRWGRLDCLINNASEFFPTPLPTADEQQWDQLINSNLRGPFFLCQALGDELKSHRGAIVNIADIYGARPLDRHAIYSIAKAGNLMLTRTMAKELAPLVRVNGIAPGVILWPEVESAKENKKKQSAIVEKIPLNRMGKPDDIARLAAFLITKASYITGQTIAVDGGKHLVF